MIVSYAGLVLCLLGPTGLILWWRTRRASVRWNAASWFRRCFDLHQCIGIYAGVFLWIAAFTGVLIGFNAAEKAIYSLTRFFRPNPAAGCRSPLPFLAWRPIRRRTRHWKRPTADHAIRFR